MKLFIISLLLVVFSVSVFAEVINSSLVNSDGYDIGVINADISASQEEGKFLVQITRQSHTSSLQNFIGCSMSKFKFLNSQGTELEGALAQSNPSNNDLASGSFPDITFSALIPESAVRVVVYYSVVGSGKTPEDVSTTIETHEQKTFTINLMQTSLAVPNQSSQLPAQQTPPTKPIEQLPTASEKQCSCLCQEICENKKISDCQTIERLAGKATEYGTSGKVSGGFWKGSVVLRNDFFSGNCVGCSESVNVQVKGVNCDAVCRQTCDTREGVAKRVASDAVKVCFNTFADACSTVGKSQAPVSQPTTSTANKKEQTPDTRLPVKEERVPDQTSTVKRDKIPETPERTEPARKKVITSKPITFTQVLVSVIDWFEELFGKPKVSRKTCTCTCNPACDTTLVYGCRITERTEQQTNGIISEWGTAVGVVTNGNWKGLVKKEGKEFVGTCAVCSDKIIITDVASEASKACDTPCNNACVKNSKTVQRGAGDECRKSLEEVCL